MGSQISLAKIQELTRMGEQDNKTHRTNELCPLIDKVIQEQAINGFRFARFDLDERDVDFVEKLLFLYADFTPIFETQLSNYHMSDTYWITFYW